jgi:predicted anti-sigma-YlaC factor YlaD
MVGGRLGDDTKAPDSLDKADLREAYDRGRNDERARRKRHPIGMTLTFAAAAVGVVILALALVNGSFTAAGSQVDQGLRIAKPAASQAASNAGDQLRDAAAQARTKAANAG